MDSNSLYYGDNLDILRRSRRFYRWMVRPQKKMIDWLNSNSGAVGGR